MKMKAFPYVREVPSDKDGYKAYAHEDGMDLRDYFAAKIMQSFALAFKDDDEWNAYEQSFIAYQIADAMMEERKEKK